MKFIIILFLLFNSFCVLGQEVTKINCVYAVEGVIIDGDSYQAISNAILKNEKLGITSISDDRGYFSFAFPIKYLDSGKTVGLEILKKGYNTNKCWLSYNPIDSLISDTSKNCLTWNYDLKMIRLTKSNTNGNSSISSHIRIDSKEHGFSGISKAFEQYLKSSKRGDKLSILKKNNENVLFNIDGEYIICTDSTSTFFNNKNILVYVNNRKVKLEKINTLLKRSTTIENNENRHKYFSVHKNSKLHVIFLETKN